MESNTTHHMPWLHQASRPSSSLIVQGLEIVVPPGQIPPRHYSHQSTSKAFPPLLTDIPSNRYWNDTSGSWETPIHREMTSSTTRLVSVDVRLQSVVNSPRRTSRYSEEAPRTLRTPQMTKSSQKILQLTGFDPRFERLLPIQHQQIDVPRTPSPAPSSSSGSVCSQPGIPHDNKNEVKSCWSWGESSPNLSNTGKYLLQSSFYRLSEHQVSAIPSTTSLRYRGHQEEIQSRSVSQPAMGQYAKMDQSQITALRELVTQELECYSSRVTQDFENHLKCQHRHDLTDSDILNIVPRPLAFRPKIKTKHLSLDTKLGLLRNARNSLEWGISEVTSANKTKHYNKPTTLLFEDESVLRREAAPSPKSRNKPFGTGNHPLKSPFPFDQLEEVQENSPVESTFSKRVSGVLKQFSGSSPTSPKGNVISNRVRRPHGPDTPLPSKTGFIAFPPTLEMTMQKRGVHFQDVFTKAKRTVRFNSVDERKRESLKKSIAVVGISDQSPDGRVAEWF